MFGRMGGWGGADATSLRSFVAPGLLRVVGGKVDRRLGEMSALLRIYVCYKRESVIEWWDALRTFDG